MNGQYFRYSGKIIMIVFIVSSIITTYLFGNHILPQTIIEAICDVIHVFGMLVGIILYTIGKELE